MGAAREGIELLLNELTRPRAPLGKDSPHATVNIYPLTDRTRRRFRSDLIEQCIGQLEDVEHGGRAAIVTAGPPGAGKTTEIGSLGLVDGGWRVIDADVIKDLLLGQAVADGIFGDLQSDHLKSYGFPLLLNELAALVHTESTMLAGLLLDRALAERENVVIEGTLSWSGLPEEYLLKLASNDYERLTILDVEVGLDTALMQASNRWWSGRTDALNGTGPASGGRFTPRNAIIDAFLPDGSASACNVNAVKLFRNPRARNFAEVQLIVKDRTGAADVEHRYVAQYGVLAAEFPMTLKQLQELYGP